MIEFDISTRTHPDCIVKIDEADAHLFAGVKWSPDVRPCGIRYAHRKPATGKIYLHRLIMAAPNGVIVDHIDRDGLNNTRANLRLVSASDNGWNKSGRGRSAFKGVWEKRKRWAASITHKGEVFNLGVFDEAEDAAVAFDAAALHLGRDRTGLNFPERDTVPHLSVAASRTSPFDYPGIRRLDSGNFNVRVIRAGRRVNIGTFATLDQAVAAWENKHGA